MLSSKNVTKNVNINGYVTDTGIKNVFHSSHDDKAKRDGCITADPQSCYGYVDKISVKLIDNCAKKLKVGKACGSDNIGAEHILYDTSSICIFKLYSNLSCVIDLFPIVLVLGLLSPWLRIKQEH